MGANGFETFISQTNLGATPVEESQPLSIRAFLLGSLLCLLIGVGTIYANAIIQGTFMAWCFSNPSRSLPVLLL